MVETESDVDDIFDFEITHAPTPKKRRKVIGLDDILNDLKEEGRGGKKKSKGTKARKHSTLDDDDDDTETKLLQAVGHFQQKIKEFDGQNGFFGSQRTPSPLVHSKLGDCMLSKAFMSSKLKLLVELHSDRGETFFTGLLLNGWLSKLVFKCGCIEEAIAIWTFNLLSYSSEESLRSSACDFWCAILLFNEVDAPPLKFEWLPSYSELKRALESFGYLFHSPTNILSDECLVNSNFERSRATK
ncbi:hypothetical protein Nepgr_012775 [Nepenthes gracilis]|uniref:Uncharacterized protein n=1 Tax=Nepenthes gracilis TaxID=150966 RepID=A0AAD3XNH1_NEPGR|nr:hypothetical protein Nepgr_012775 [Nepenthes gracilis]